MMSQHLNDIDSEPWYKQGWPWALIAIPFLTVIAGVITIMIAYDTDDSLVKDNYYKEGLALNNNFKRLDVAKNNNMLASLHIDLNANLARLEIQSDAELKETITVMLYHPTLGKMDRVLKFIHLSGNEYISEFKDLESSLWHLSIEDDTKNWLLKSRWQYPEKTSLTINAKK